MARETVSLYGRVLSSGRAASTSRPSTRRLRRRIFVEEALVRATGWTGPRSSSPRMPSLPPRARAGCEAKLRRAGTLLAADDVLAESSTTAAHSATSRGHARLRALVGGEEQRALRGLDRAAEVLLAAAPAGIRSQPTIRTIWKWTATVCRCAWRFDPTDPMGGKRKGGEGREGGDGVTLDVAARRCWQNSRPGSPCGLAGCRGTLPKETGPRVLRACPRNLRRELVPISPDSAGSFVAGLQPSATARCSKDSPRLVTAARRGAGRSGAARGRQAVPWLRMNLRVLDAGGRELRRSRDLETLRRELGRSARAARGRQVRTPGSRARDPPLGLSGISRRGTDRDGGPVTAHASASRTRARACGAPLRGCGRCLAATRRGVRRSPRSRSAAARPRANRRGRCRRELALLAAAAGADASLSRRSPTARSVARCAG